MKRCFVTVLAYLLLVMAVSVMPVSASVAPFSGGSGANPVEPLSVALVGSSAAPGAYAVGDTYTHLTDNYTMMETKRPDGNNWTFIGVIARNPVYEGNNAFVRLTKNGAVVNIASLIDTSATAAQKITTGFDFVKDEWRFERGAALFRPLPEKPDKLLAMKQGIYYNCGKNRREYASKYLHTF